MKSLYNKIRTQANSKYQFSHVVSQKDCHSNGALKDLVLLQLIEKVKEKPTACLNEVSTHYTKELIQVDMHVYNKVYVHDRLVFEARFYEVDKRTVALKVFVRKVGTNHKTTRISRTSYVYKAIYNAEENKISA